MTDRKSSRLVDYTGIFFEPQQSTAEQFRIQQRLLQEAAHVATPSE